MLALRYDPKHLEADLSDEPDAYAGLETEVIVLLGTDARVAPGEVPRGRLNRGWWADSVPLPSSYPELGSRLWLLEAAGSIAKSVRLAEKWAEKRLGHLIAEGRVAALRVEGELAAGDRINLAVNLLLPDGFTVGPIRLQW